MIQLHDLYFEPFISTATIEKAVQDVARQINKDFKDTTPVFLVVLNGAFFFASDLIKQFEGPCETNFIKVSSYSGTQSTGDVKTILGIDESLKGKKIILIEDIVDTGNTLEVLLDKFQELAITDYKVASLFFKPNAYKKSFPIDYVGLEIENDFIVGYGLDYNELGRNLTTIYKLKPNP